MFGFSFRNIHQIAAGSPPVVTSVYPNRTTVIGGTPLTITGSNLTGTTSVVFGSFPATSVVVVNDTTVTCVSPVGMSTGGGYNAAVTGPGGVGYLSGALTVTNPATLDLSAFNIGGNYSATTGIWTGLASAGTSGPVNPPVQYYPSTGKPITTAAPSGVQVPRVGVSAVQLFLAGKIGDWFSGTAGTVVIAQYIYSASTDLGTDADGQMFSGQALQFTTSIRSSTKAIRTQIAGSGLTTVTPPAGWHIQSIKFANLGPSGTCSVRINGGAWVTAPSTVSIAAVIATYGMWLGANAANGNWIGSAMGCIFASKSALSDSDIADLERYAADYVGGITLP